MESKIIKPSGSDYILADKVKISFDHIIKLVKGHKINNINDIVYDNNTKLWHCTNYKGHNSLIKILYGNYNFEDIMFINGDYNDYTIPNLAFKLLETKVEPPSKYKILKIGDPVTIVNGACAREQRNMYWKVEDENKDTYYLMHIKDELFTKISKRDINKVLLFNDKRPTWRLFQNGYVCCTVNIKSKQKVYYLHQYIMDVHTEDLTDFEKTVDHINRDKLDNRRDNLQFANMSVQNTNRDKAARRCDAKIELPEWLDELPKYVQYRQEIYDKTNNMMRDFFVISHPALDKIWESSKSMNIHLKDKFKATKLKLELLNNNITEQNYNKESGDNNKLDLPIGIRITNKDDKYHFIYDYRDVKTNKRYSLKKVISSKDIQTELDNFIDEINKKYPKLNYMKYTIMNINAIKQIAKNIIVVEKVDINIAEMKSKLPPNFSIITEKNINYLSFTKTIDRVKYNMKKVIKSNNLMNEIDKLVCCINRKYKIHLSVKID
jgi:hypothetical protein